MFKTEKNTPKLKSALQSVIKYRKVYKLIWENT